MSSARGVSYDFGSVMHYSKTSFSVGSEATIVTKIPAFMDVIGQRMGFSAGDLAKLNRLYNCSKSSDQIKVVLNRTIRRNNNKAKHNE